MLHRALYFRVQARGEGAVGGRGACCRGLVDQVDQQGSKVLTVYLIPGCLKVHPTDPLCGCVGLEGGGCCCYRVVPYGELVSRAASQI